MIWNPDSPLASSRVSWESLGKIKHLTHLIANNCPYIEPYLDDLIQQSPELQVLQIANCHASYESLGRALINVASFCNKLNELKFDISRCNEQSAIFLIDTLCSTRLNESLTSLSLEDPAPPENRKSNIGLLKRLSETFSHLKILKMPNYYFNSTEEKDALTKFEQLEELHIGSLNNDLWLIQGFTQSFPNLKTLVIDDVDIRLEDFQSIIRSFPQLTKLKTNQFISSSYLKLFHEKNIELPELI